MDRREFTGLVAAGALFPADFVKGLAVRADVPRSQSGARIFCCGSEDNPVTTEQINLLSEFLEKEKRWSYVIDYGRQIEAPISAIYELDFPFERLVVGIGSESRPAQEEDLVDVKNQLLELADVWEESNIITHHNFYPYEWTSQPLHPPIVVTDRWAKSALRHSMIRKVPPQWSHAFVSEWEWEHLDDTIEDDTIEEVIQGGRPVPGYVLD